MMEPASTSEDAPKAEQQAPKVMYDNGHDNKVFVGDNSVNGSQTHQSRPRIQSNGSTNSYYLHTQPNALENGENGKQQTFRIIENSRL